MLRLFLSIYFCFFSPQTFSPLLSLNFTFFTQPIFHLPHLPHLHHLPSPFTLQLPATSHGAYTLTMEWLIYFICCHLLAYITCFPETVPSTSEWRCFIYFPLGVFHHFRLPLLESWIGLELTVYSTSAGRFDTEMGRKGRPESQLIREVSNFSNNSFVICFWSCRFPIRPRNPI